VQKFDSLLKAWENQHSDTIRFEHTKGEPLVDRSIVTWVDELPKVLVLQLNRSEYLNGALIKQMH
jgi:hypothetical protein